MITLSRQELQEVDFDIKKLVFRNKDIDQLTREELIEALDEALRGVKLLSERLESAQTP